MLKVKQFQLLNRTEPFKKRKADELKAEEEKEKRKAELANKVKEKYAELKKVKKEYFELLEEFNKEFKEPVKIDVDAADLREFLDNLFN